ncbi:uncharacterized protein LOC144828826 [Lissotriton helveticus]
MADRELLLSVLNALTKKQYHSVLFHLTDPDRNPHLSRLETDDITPTDLVQKLVETYTKEALRTIADIMSLIGRMDLFEKLRNKLGDSSTELTDVVQRQEQGDLVNCSRVSLQGQQTDVVQRQEQGDLVNCSRVSPQAQQKGCDKLVTDKQLMRLAKCLGKSWKQIGIEVLGIENNKLEQIEEDNQNNLVMKSFTMLKAWKNKEKKKATPVHLHQLLSSEGVPLEPEAYDFLDD